MAIDGIPNPNNNITSEAIRHSYMALPTNRKKKKYDEDNGADLVSAVSSVEISEMGQKLALINETLEKIEDPAERRRAQEGLERIKEKLAQRKDPSLMKRFLQSWEGAKGSGSLGRYFAEAAEAGNRLDLEDFVQKLSGESPGPS